MDDEPEFADEQGERQGFNIDKIIGKTVFSDNHELTLTTHC